MLPELHNKLQSALLNSSEATDETTAGGAGGLSLKKITGLATSRNFHKGRAMGTAHKLGEKLD